MIMRRLRMTIIANKILRTFSELFYIIILVASAVDFGMVCVLMSVQINDIILKS